MKSQASYFKIIIFAGFICFNSTFSLATNTVTNQTMLLIQQDTFVLSRKISDVADTLVQGADSLQTYSQKVESITTRLDSMQHRVTVKMDSLRALSSLDLNELKMLDSLNGKLSGWRVQLDSLSNLGRLPTGKTQEVLSSLEGKISEPLSRLEQGLNGKLSLFSQNGAQGLPAGINLGDKLNIEGVSIPPSGLSGVDLPSGEIDGAVPSNVSSLAETNLPNVNLEQLNKVTDMTSQAGAYGEDIKNIVSGDFTKLEALPEALENEALQLDALEGVGDELNQAKAFEDRMKRYYDPQVAKEEALNQAKEVAINHFAGKEKELMAAVEQLAKIKSKYKEVPEVVDMFKKRTNPVKGKSFKERSILGLTLQIQKENSVWLDLNPQVTYQLSRRFFMGGGWNYRLAYNFDDQQFKSTEQIVGPRAFVHFKMRENLYLKSDVEYMHMFEVDKQNPTEVKNERWDWNYLAGIKQEFRFSKKMKGNVQMMYNLFDRYNTSPYTHRFNIRMGIEWERKK